MNQPDNIENLTTLLQDLPWSGMIPVIGAILVGFMLWLAGRRILRIGMAAGGFLLGATLGWMLAQVFPADVSPWITAIVCAITFACLAALLYRIAIAWCLAVVLGIAAPLGVWTIDGFSGQIDNLSNPEEAQGSFQVWDFEDMPGGTPSDQPKTDDFDEWLGMDLDNEDLPKLDLPVDIDPQNGLIIPNLLESQAGSLAGIDTERLEQVKGYASWCMEKTKSLWDQVPQKLRPIMIGASAVGVMLGFMLGALTTHFSAAIVTAFGGSLLMLGSGQILVDRAGFFDTSRILSSPMAWLITWVSLGIIGTVFQWIIRPRRADNSSE